MDMDNFLDFEGGLRGLFQSEEELGTPPPRNARDYYKAHGNPMDAHQ
jgi:hypothetical protein